jgi:hypothetical protein
MGFLQCHSRDTLLCCARTGGCPLICCTRSLLRYYTLSGALCCTKGGAFYSTVPRQGPSAVPGQSALFSAVPGPGELLCQSKGLLLSVLHQVRSPLPYQGRDPLQCQSRVPLQCQSRVPLLCVWQQGPSAVQKQGSFAVYQSKIGGAVPWQRSSCSNFLFYKIFY